MNWLFNHFKQTVVEHEQNTLNTGHSNEEITMKIIKGLWLNVKPVDMDVLQTCKVAKCNQKKNYCAVNMSELSCLKNYSPLICL